MAKKTKIIATIGIRLDLQGPKIRTGMLKDRKPVLLKKNRMI